MVAYVVIALVALFLFQRYLLAPMTTPANRLDHSDLGALKADRPKARKKQAW